jgi:hypothetical protein
MSQTLTKLLDLIGEDATLALVEARAGHMIYVPRDAKDATELAKIIGLDAARKLGQEFPGVPLQVPVAREWRVTIYSARGHTVPDIAFKVGSHIDTVRKIRRSNGLQRAQMDLFSDV